MQHNQDVRRLLCRERVEQLARDGYDARDGRRRARGRRGLLRHLLGAAAHRRARQMQPAGR
jgi:hypothetical protein